MSRRGNTKCVTEACTNTATSVILVRTWMEDDRHSTTPAYWPVFTCTDCAPEVMHELVAQGDEREDMVTAVIDTPPVDDGTAGGAS